VFLAGDLIIKPFSEAVRERYPAAVIRPPIMPAVGGGVRVACGRLGWDYDSIKEKLVRSLS
jgi:hypothetical protein